jgi:hypothetical protein
MRLNATIALTLGFRDSEKVVTCNKETNISMAAFFVTVSTQIGALGCLLAE